MPITLEQLPARVLETQTRIVEVLGKQPFLDFTVVVCSGDRPWMAHFYPHNIDSMEHFHASDADELFAKVDAALDAWSSPEEIALRDFQKDLTKLIDKGHTAGIDTQFVEPLRPVAKALTDNLLTYQATP